MSAVQKAIAKLGDESQGKDAIQKIAAEIHRRGITAEEVGQIQRFSMYQSLTKNEEGEAEIHDLYGFRISPAFESGPEWPVVQPGNKVSARIPAVKPEKSTGEQVVILPDMQIGYFRDFGGSLVSTHDEDAIEVALAITKAAKPTKVVMLGDNLDLPAFSKYRMSDAFAQTTQAAIDYATELMARLRSVVPEGCELHWLAGNHEERLQNHIIDNAKAAFGLKQGSPTPGDWPVLSVPHLCRLDDYGVTYHPGYPASDMWLHKRLRIIHGDRVKSRGSTAHLYLNSEKSSVIYGHIHRIERAHRTREDYDGTKEIMAASPGCLARCSGEVPSTKQGLDLDGRPIQRAEDWQLGMAVVVLHEDSFDYEQIRIDPTTHRAFWRGKEYSL